MRRRQCLLHKGRGWATSPHRTWSPLWRIHPMPLPFLEGTSIYHGIHSRLPRVFLLPVLPSYYSLCSAWSPSSLSCIHLAVCQACFPGVFSMYLRCDSFLIRWGNAGVIFPGVYLFCAGVYSSLESAGGRYYLPIVPAGDVLFLSATTVCFDAPLSTDPRLRIEVWVQ